MGQHSVWLENAQSLGPDLEVSFILATDPNTTPQGRIVKVAKSTKALKPD